MTALRPTASLALLFALAACGGGGSTGTAPPPPPPATPGSAALSVAIAGGAGAGVDHLWVTVTGVALHADANRVYGDGDPGWIVEKLAAPISVDLADPALAAGQAVSLLKQSLPTSGTFAQLRLLVASSDANAELAASATAAGLTYNDQVQYTDAGGTHVVPLEIPDLLGGLRLLTSFTLSAGTTTPLSIEWNAHSSLVRRASPTGVARFTLRNELQLYNQVLTALGKDGLQIDDSIFDSISGQLDTTQFCTDAGRDGCIHDVIASATSVSADGRFHREVRSVQVGATGGFLLYPLPSDSTYDVVIHGANMQTIVVRGVFVDPTGLLKPFPTALSSVATPIVPVLDTTGRAVAVANALVPPSSRVVFGQTLAGTGGTGGDLPYVIAYGAADPLTGLLAGGVTVPGGPIHDAAYDRVTEGVGIPPPFTTVTPAEGAGGFSVWSEGTLADAASATLVLAPAATGVTAPAPARLAGFSDGTLAVTIAGSATNGADRAEIVVSNDGGVVAVADASALLASHATTTITVPSGQASATAAPATAAAAARYSVGAAHLAGVRRKRDHTLDAPRAAGRPEHRDVGQRHADAALRQRRAAHAARRTRHARRTRRRAWRVIATLAALASFNAGRRLPPRPAWPAPRTAAGTAPPAPWPVSAVSRSWPGSA